MTFNNILFTGPPGCGKTTLIRRIVQELQTPSTGFLTKEIREKGESSPETPPFVLNRSTGEWTRPEACSRSASAFILPQPLLLMSSAALPRQQGGNIKKIRNSLFS